MIKYCHNWLISHVLVCCVFNKKAQNCLVVVIAKHCKKQNHKKFANSQIRNNLNNRFISHLGSKRHHKMTNYHRKWYILRNIMLFWMARGRETCDFSFCFFHFQPQKFSKVSPKTFSKKNYRVYIISIFIFFVFWRRF